MSNTNTERRSLEQPKHTPGPWGADYMDRSFGQESGWMVTSPGGSVVMERIKANDFPITSRKICDVTSSNYVPEPVAAANARLIAAAPDLLAAIKPFVNRPLFEGFSVEEWNQFVANARAAIAKAEGRAQ